MRIEDLDPNFKPHELHGIKLDFMPVPKAPMEIDGLPFWEEEHRFLRIPEKELKNVSSGVAELATNMPCVQLRFKTDSQMIGIRVRLRNEPAHGNFSSAGSSGFDLYTGRGFYKRHLGLAKPITQSCEFTEQLMRFPNDFSGYMHSPQGDFIPGTNLREITINFPPYNGIESLELGFVPGSHIEAPEPFAIKKPIVFYGSSITQGGCVSRPGNHYILHLSRRLNANVVCQGYSGNAKGELIMADIMTRIPMSVFVFDYDHNAPNVDFLKKTHYPFYQYFRERCPNVPIVFASNTSPALDYPNWLKRLEVVRETYERAYNSGDKRVVFLDGTTIFSEPYGDACTVDGCHPNDLGFFRMADSFERAVREALSLV